MIYRYEAVSFSGSRVKGSIEAGDEHEAVVKLKENHHIVTKLVPVQKMAGLLAKEIGSIQIDARTLMVLCSQFSIILASGISVVKTVELVHEQMENKKLRRILKETRQLLASGRGLAESFQEADKNAFPAVFLETVRAGEQHGTLDAAFKNLSSYYERQYKMQQKLSAVMVYPSFVLAVGLVVIAVVMTLVIPSLANVFEEFGGELPLLTRILVEISEFFQKYLFHGIVVLLIGMIFIVCYVRTEKGRLIYHRMKLKVPVWGNIRLLTAAGQFAHTVQVMMTSGLTLPQALDVTARVTENYMLAKTVYGISEKIEEGYGLGDCMKEAACYPNILNEVCAIGEKTGELEKLLDSIGQYFDSQADFAASKAISMLEPVLLLVMAVFAGLVVISIYLPLFTMYELI